MAASIVQTATANANAAVVTATFSAAPTSGNIVVAIINSDNIFTVSGSPTNRYSYLNDQQFDVYEYTGTLPTSVTATPSSADECAVTLLELSGVSSYDLASVGTNVQTTHTSTSVASATTTAANDLCIAVVAIHGQRGILSSPVWSNSFTSTVNNISTVTEPNQPAVSQWVASKVQALAGATGSTSVSWTTSADNSNTVLLTYKATSGGTSGAVTAVAATASASARIPTVSTGSSGSVTAVAATATTLAAIPSVSGDAVVSGGGPASATATAPTPAVAGSVSGSVAAVKASAAATAPTPAVAGSVSGSVAAVKASAAAAAPTPAVAGSGSGVVTVLAAVATGSAHGPVVSSGATIGATAATASSSALAASVSASGSATVSAPAATATGRAKAPFVTAQRSAEVVAPAAGATARGWPAVFGRISIVRGPGILGVQRDTRIVKVQGGVR